MIFDPGSSIVKSVLDFRLSSVSLPTGYLSSADFVKIYFFRKNPERIFPDFFKKVDFERKQSIKSMQNYPVGKHCRCLSTPLLI